MMAGLIMITLFAQKMYQPIYILQHNIELSIEFGVPSLRKCWRRSRQFTCSFCRNGSL